LEPIPEGRKGGLLALRQIERRLGLADRLARRPKDRRMPEKVVHRLAEIIWLAC
jgi:hypothetical protein